jgi:hypothetical protein
MVRMESEEIKRFVWHTYDLGPVLPPDWQKSVLGIVGAELTTNMIDSSSTTSRESESDTELITHVVSGEKVALRLPWFRELYTGLFAELAQRLSPEPVSTASSAHHWAWIQVQQGADERYECHVDTCPLVGLLYVTDHPRGSGGELVIANRGDVRGRMEVDRDATRVYPVAGNLIFFDARCFTHYVAPLNDPDAIRVVIPMAFFTPSCPETARPLDLDRYLGLE